MKDPMKVVLITGMSGAGRSQTATWFEDQGYYCIDNVPPAMIPHFIEVMQKDTNSLEKIAFVTDVRSSGFFQQIIDLIKNLKSRADINLSVLFVQASSKELVRRYNEVRRSHPMTGGEASLAVIEEEANKLAPVKALADYVLDTTNLKIAEMYQELDDMVLGGSATSHFTINVSSFGFKYGIPTEADVMFDVRFLKNPYYVAELKKLTGRNKKVKAFIFKDPLAQTFVDSIHELLTTLVEGYSDQGKYHLNVAFGCTGGHHRSVAIAEAVAESFEKDGRRVKLYHRDMSIAGNKSRNAKSALRKLAEKAEEKIEKLDKTEKTDRAE